MGGLSFIVLVGFFIPPAGAQISSDDPIRFLHWVGDDPLFVGKSVISQRSLILMAGTTGTVLVLYRLDPVLSRITLDLTEGGARLPRRVLNEVGNAKMIRPATLVFFLGTLLSGDERMQDAAFTSFEAVVFANLATNMLKGIVGRARPWQEEGAASFKPFSGNTSFPSGHATTAFAFTTPWLLYYANVPSGALFGLGVLTAFVRMADNVHWFTDVLVGGAIGFGTGYLLSRRHQRAGLHPVVAAHDAGLNVYVRF